MSPNKNETYGSQIAPQLMGPLLNQGCCVIMDNLFASPYLFHTLCSKQTDAMGTLRRNRKGIPAEIKSAKLKKGEHVTVYKDRLMISGKKQKTKQNKKKIFVS
jgi:hypothetical protein